MAGQCDSYLPQLLVDKLGALLSLDLLLQLCLPLLRAHTQLRHHDDILDEQIRRGGKVGLARCHFMLLLLLVAGRGVLLFLHQTGRVHPHRC